MMRVDVEVSRRIVVSRGMRGGPVVRPPCSRRWAARRRCRLALCESYHFRRRDVGVVMESACAGLRSRRYSLADPSLDPYRTMRSPFRRASQSALLMLLTAAATAAGQATPPAPIATSISNRTTGYERSDGFIPLYLDARQGRILFELPRDSTRAVLVITQATGLGSNPIGIDRGSDGTTQVVRFDRDGERVLVVFENWNYRSSATSNAAHQRTVLEAFPPSTVAAMPLLAAESGKLLVDATELVMRDWTRVAETLASSRQGTYTVARERSSIYRAYTKALPMNTEIDVALTFTTNGAPGPIVERTVTDGHALTLRQHLALLALPNDGYMPRASEPGVG